MQYRPLGKTGAQVSVIGLGLGPMMSLSLEAGVLLIRRAVDLGINYLDTARSYGETEVMAGQALKGRREGVFLSTKTGARTRDEAWRSIQESLQRLQTDHVDNCHLHAINEGEDMDTRLGPGGAMEALVEARNRGWVRHIGCSAHTSRDLLYALERFDFDVILVPMNIVEREPLAELIPLCRERGVGVTIMKPVATGLLPARLALKWLANQPIATAVPGVSTVEELELDVAVGDLPDFTLDVQEQAEIGALREQLDRVRCRICRKCDPCPHGIIIGDVLGSEIMYDHYRTMGREQFAAFPWGVEFITRDMHRKEELIPKIEACAACGDCVAKCPYDLPVVPMLESMLPAFRDMLRIYNQRLRCP